MVLGALGRNYFAFRCVGCVFFSLSRPFSVSFLSHSSFSPRYRLLRSSISLYLYLPLPFPLSRLPYSFSRFLSHSLSPFVPECEYEGIFVKETRAFGRRKNERFRIVNRRVRLIFSLSSFIEGETKEMLMAMQSRAELWRFSCVRKGEFFSYFDV